MLAGTKQKTTGLLSGNDKAMIAAVLTWDLCKQVTPEEVEAVRVSGEWVTVRLSCHRAVPIHRDVFRSILQQQKASMF